MPFVLKEIEGDLFSAPVEYALGHCVAADLGMGKGIAVRFKQLFGQVDNLRKQNVGVGGVGVIQHSDKRYIYYLVTKKSSYQKPTYADLFSSLNAMKDHMVLNGVSKIAMPRIGCGLDGMVWDKVHDLLNEVFSNENVEIVIYTFKG